MHTLYLGSQSFSRQFLLKEIGIPFELLKQDADETQCDWNQPLETVVTHIARFKMDNLELPHETVQGKQIFVLTADTLNQDYDGRIRGKPTDQQDAIEKIKAARNGVYLATAFCLEKKEWRDGQWNTINRIEQVVTASFKFIIPDEWIERYFKHSLGLKTSGAIAAEGYGLQFLQSVHGSYTTILGLPLFEVRQALEILGFFE